MRNFASQITGLALLPLFILALTFEGKTNLAGNLQRDRASVERKLRINHSNTTSGEFYAKAFEANVRELDGYAKQVNHEKVLYPDFARSLGL